MYIPESPVGFIIMLVVGIITFFVCQPNKKGD